MSVGKLKKIAARRVLGIDASTNSMAFCLYDQGEPTKWGEINFVGATVFERLADGQKKISSFSKDLEFDLIVIEAATFIQNKRTVILLSYAFGSIISALMRNGANVVEIPPITWQNYIQNKALTKDEKIEIQNLYPDKSKSWYSGKYREVRKQRTIKWVEDTFGVSLESDDVADAFGIGWAGVHKFTS